MSDRYYEPRVGDRVKFTEQACGTNFRDGGKVDARRRMVVVSIDDGYGDVVLNDGERWSPGWLELADDRWRVRKRGTTWIAIHPEWGVRAVVRSWGVAFGIAYRAARKETERMKEATDG